MTQTFRCSACGALNRVTKSRGGRPRCGRCKRRLDTSGAPQDVNAADLERVLAKAPVPVLVDFWAPWCPPCRMAAPLLDDVARRRAGDIIVLKVNGDEQPDASARHGVQSLPTFVMFMNGDEAARQVGLPPKMTFEDWIDRQVVI